MDYTPTLKKIGLPVQGVRWYQEFPVAPAHIYQTSEWRGGGGPYRIDAIAPTLQIAVECKTLPRYLTEGRRQMERYMHQLYEYRGVWGDWDAIVTDGNRLFWSRWFAGEQNTKWDEIDTRSLMRMVKLPQFHPSEEWEWMSKGVNLYYKDGHQGIECSRCKQWKHITEYNRNKKRRSGYCNECRHPCYQISLQRTRKVA